MWLGRWIERAQTIALVVRWAAAQDSSSDQLEIETTLRVAASIRGLTVQTGKRALDLLLTRDSGAAVRGCLVAARFNATHVAPVEVLQLLGEAIDMLDADGPPITSPQGVIALMDQVLPTFDRLHSTIEQAWFHSTPLSEGEVYGRFVQQQQ